jgi:hypothetical protein
VSYAADYLVVGAGASGMSFVDVLLEETDASIVMVDRRDSPGGHWTDAYPFVRLHQPAQTYGVNSRSLGQGRIEKEGTNRGYYELSSGREIARYYESLMSDVFLESGRVTFLPCTEYIGNNTVRSLLSGEEQQLVVNRKLVDATPLMTTVPMTHQRKYSVSDDVECIPPNLLPLRAAKHSHYVVVGAGKTAMDAIGWLLDHACPASAITWIMPRDAWTIRREATQPGIEFFDHTIGTMAGLYEVAATAESLESLCAGLEEIGFLRRFSQDSQPSMFHAAVLTDAEAQRLRDIGDVVRLGHVLSIEAGRLIMAQGEHAVPSGSLFIDCTASAVAENVNRFEPVFSEGKIALHMIRQFQPCFSAGLIAHLEATVESDEEKNALSQPTPMIDKVSDWPQVLANSIENQGKWMMNPDVAGWIGRTRLDHPSKTLASIPRDDAEKWAVVARLQQHAPAAVANLRRMQAAL